MNFSEEIKWRGLWHTASEGFEEHIATNRIAGYIGFDPTASSLHVGSFLQIMLLVRLQRSGHTPIAIVGGGTGLIGDPSGRSSERQLLTKEMTDANLQGIRKQLERFLDFSAVSNAAKIINNADWLVHIPMVDFMRDIGKHFTVNYMLAKDSVDRRIGNEDGISFTEFKLHAASGLRLSHAGPEPQLHAADGRQRSVGQHHGRNRFDPQSDRQARTRSGCASDHERFGSEIRQDRRWADLAGPATDIA